MPISSILLAVATLLGIQVLAQSTTTTAGFGVPNAEDNDGAGVGVPRCSSGDRRGCLSVVRLMRLTRGGTRSLTAEVTDFAAGSGPNVVQIKEAGRENGGSSIYGTGQSCSRVARQMNLLERKSIQFTFGQYDHNLESFTRSIFLPSALPRPVDQLAGSWYASMVEEHTPHQEIPSSSVWKQHFFYGKRGAVDKSVCESDYFLPDIVPSETRREDWERSVHSNPNLATSDQDKDLPAPPPLAAPALYPFVSAPGSIFDSEEYKQAQAMSTSRPTSLALPSSSTSHPRPLSTSPEITVSPPPGLSASQDRDDNDEDRRGEGRESRGSQGSGTSIPAAVSEVEFVGSATRHRFESDVPAVVKTSPVTEHHPASVLTHPNPEPQSTERSTDPETPPLQPPALWLRPSSTQHQPHAEEPSLKEAQESIPDVVRQSASPSLRLVTAPREAREATKVQEAPPSSYTGTAHVLSRKITEESMSAILASGPSFLGAPVPRGSSISGGALTVDSEDGERGADWGVKGGAIGGGEGELVAVESTLREVVPKPEGGFEVTEESVEVKVVAGKEPEVVTDEDEVVEDEKGNRFKVVENTRFSSVGKGEGTTTAAAVRPDAPSSAAAPQAAPAVPAESTAQAASAVASTTTTTTTVTAMAYTGHFDSFPGHYNYLVTNTVVAVASFLTYDTPGPTKAEWDSLNGWIGMCNCSVSHSCCSHVRCWLTYALSPFPGLSPSLYTSYPRRRALSAHEDATIFMQQRTEVATDVLKSN
ncbi:hypothetical protein NMY22_g19393 [Coprinellus aureogranulatus]|nr:hypothetical protein NMY22_g19393 [Coprinellus aureogranulatus]